MTPLHHFGDLVRDAMLAIPLSWVRGLFLSTLIAVLVWVLLLPRSETTPAGGAKRWDENLKYGAALALGIQIIIYCCL